MFPVEIWENILHKTEALSLTRLCTVNSTWNAIITKHLQQSDAWYKQCENDIPKIYWFILLENSFHSISLRKKLEDDKKDNKCDYKVWITMYKAWLKWKNAHNYNVFVTEEFSPIPNHRLSERITCCSVLGELVAVGSSEGYIRVYNLNTNKLVFQVDRYEEVESVKLWVQGKSYEKIILIATSFHKKVCIWDIISQKILLKRRSGFVVCTGHAYYCVGLQGETIIIQDIASERNFSVKLLMNDYNIKSNRNQIECVTSSLHPINMAISMYKLCCLYSNGLYCEIDLKKICENNALYEPQVTNLGAPKKQQVARYYLFNPHAAFCITDKGYLGISVYKSKWKVYNLFPLLEGLISTILFHVRILVIGLDTGDVCLFSVKDALGLNTIDFKKSKRIHISSEPIVSVNIMEILEDQRLLITTKRTVYNIKLDYA